VTDYKGIKMASLKLVLVGSRDLSSALEEMHLFYVENNNLVCIVFFHEQCQQFIVVDIFSDSTMLLLKRQYRDVFDKN